MKRFTTLFACALMLSISAGAAEESARPVLESATRTSATELPGGFLLVQEEVLVNLDQMTLDLLERGKREFQEKDNAAAAGSIFAASRLMAIRAKGNKADADLTTASETLAKTASEIRKGKIMSEAALNAEFATAAQQVAQFHQKQAKEFWGKKMAKAAGHSLLAATKAGERAIAWSGHKVAEGTEGVMRDARTVSGKLIEGTGFATAEVGKAIDDVGSKVDSLGKDIAGTKKVAD